MAKPEDTLLGPYRVLDLTDERGLLCGKLLGELGADVIKIEPPGGDPARMEPPFYKDDPDPEKSLTWFFTNLYKRGITLNLETDRGRDILKKLLEKTDIVVESFEPGYMKDIGLGYDDLAEIKPDLIMTSITPFGQTGPYAHYKVTDIVGVSMGGWTRTSGDMGGPPNRLSAPQFYLLGGLHGAAGTMTALYHKEMTGEGQHVDVSCQQAVVLSLMVVVEIFDMFKYSYRGMGGNYAGARPDGTILFSRIMFPCKDGHVFSFVTGASQAGMVQSSRILVEMANKQGMALELRDYPWQEIDAATIRQEELTRITNHIADFMLTQTKEQLFEAAITRGVLLCPINTVEEVVNSEQLQAREFWMRVDHPELGEKITYPGYPIHISEDVRPEPRRAPLLGEHNKEIYAELGISDNELNNLKTAGVI